MKNYKYTIHFKNGIQTEVWTNGFTNAAVLGSAWAINGGISREIEKIVDQDGDYVTDIKLEVYFFLSKIDV